MGTPTGHAVAREGGENDASGVRPTEQGDHFIKALRDAIHRGKSLDKAMMACYPPSAGNDLPSALAILLGLLQSSYRV